MKLKQRAIIKKSIREIKKTIKLEKLNSKTKQERENLKKQEHKKFNQIYVEYGQEAYKKYVPEKYQIMDINDLLKEKRFLELYNRHGKEVFYEQMHYIKMADIEYETGSKLKAKLYHAKRVFSLATALTLLMPPYAFALLINEVKYNERIEYSKEIEAYLDKIEEYAEEVKSYNLTDLQNIMLVMDDMWESIEGYGNPEMDLMACLGLDMSEPYGVGVCRNMADDVAKKLNAINSDYNARVITVYVSAGEYQTANIEQNIVEQNMSNEENSEESKVTNFFGNHAVVLMNIPGENIELVIDPTNPGIGIFQNGKITLFNAGKENPVCEKIKPLGETLLKGTDSFFTVPYNYINSIGFNDLDELENRFGLAAQNQALEEVRKLNRNEFVESIRYDITKNTATITRHFEEDTKPVLDNRMQNKEDR